MSADNSRTQPVSRRRSDDGGLSRSLLGRALLILVAVGLPLLATVMLVRSTLGTDTASVAVNGFQLTCPSDGTEGSTLECTVSNTNEEAADWPVVAILHRSTDEDRALVRGEPLDVEWGTINPAGDIDGSLWWQGDTLIAYSRFDWSGMAPAPDADNEHNGSSRTVSISLIDDGRHEGRERFYISLAPNGSRGVGILNNNATAVFVDDNDAASAETGLSTLQIDAHGSNVNVDLSDDVLTYSTTVAYDVSEITIAPTATHGTASITVDGVAVDSGGRSQTIKLHPPSTTISVVVTAEDDSTQTYTLEIARTERTENVSVGADGFTLQCPSVSAEGSALNCTLTNGNPAAADWPVVAIIHSSIDENRALITEDLLIPRSSPQYGKDLELRNPQVPAVENYNYGHGRLLSGGSWTEHLVYGYEKFDWDGAAAAGSSRSIVVDVLQNTDTISGDDNVEIFYVALAGSGYTGLSDLVANKAPVLATETAYTSRFATDATTRASSIGAETATVTVSVPSGLQASTVYLRHRIGISGSWTPAGAASISGGRAVFNLHGLSPGSSYQFEAALEPRFSAMVSGTFETATPTISTVEATSVASDTATVTVTVTDAASSTRVHLRYRPGTAGSFTDASGHAVPDTGGEATFTLTGLRAETLHQVQAALDVGFASPFPGSFRTEPPPPEITGVAVDDVTSQSATVQVDVSNAVADTAVHLRYRVSGAWTTVQPPVSGSSGTARFALSGLRPGSVHELEAALDGGFTTPAQGSLMTLSPSVSGAAASEVTHESAEVTVSVANAASSTRVFLRYGVDDGDPNTEMVWTTVSGSVAVGSDGTATSCCHR